MSAILDEIKAPVADWFDMFMKGAEDAMRPSGCNLTSLVREGTLNFNGKHLRPLLTLLVAKAMGRTDTDTIISSAVSVEFAHIASLVHDDVLDEASVRHGVPTPNIVLGPHAAVLAGDYILSRAVKYPVSKGNIRAVELLVEVMERLVEGELLQKSYSERLDIDREGYFKVISLKTSCLIGIAARLGGFPQFDAPLAKLGEYLGAAFQIKDDMLDIWSSKTGKDRYNDFKEKKITLPLILVMEKDPSVAAHVRELLSGEVDDHTAGTLTSIVTDSNVLPDLNDIMDGLKEKALSVIRTFPDCDARKALFSFTEFMAGRTY